MLRSPDSVRPATRPNTRNRVTAATGPTMRPRANATKAKRIRACRDHQTGPSPVGQTAPGIRAGTPYHMETGPDQGNQSNRHAAVLQPKDQESLGKPKEAEGGKGEQGGQSESRVGRLESRVDGFESEVEGLDPDVVS